MGSDKIEVRLDGIYALERIAYDSDRDHWTIVEVLTSFIQEKSSIEEIEEISEEQIRARAYEIWQHSNGSGTEQEHWAEAIGELEVKPVTKDVQAALTVIGRRQKKDPPDKTLDLNSANLQGARLDNANLQKAYFIGANLQGAVFHMANLQGAFLLANLQGASLSGANLQGAILDSANLQEAYLISANAQGAVFHMANLQRAVLSRANLQKANLSWVNLQGASLLDTDLRNTEGLIQPQLEGKQQPLLCNVALPESVPDKDKLKDRDCDRLPQELLKHYPKSSTSLEEAKEAVDDARQVKWE